jgi:hypothetical protein
MAFLGATPDVIPQGLPLLLPRALQILGIARPHIRAIEVANEHHFGILPAIDRVSGQVIEPSSGCVG